MMGVGFDDPDTPRPMGTMIQQPLEYEYEYERE